MKKDIYTIKRLAKELNQPRQNVRRRLIKLDIKAINQETRKYKNDPLTYSYQDFLTLADEFGVSVSSTQSSTKDTPSTTNVQQSSTADLYKNELIKTLQEQLNLANASRENLERLLDQQQQLSLNDKNKIQALELELEDFEEEKEISEETEKKKGFFSRLFRL